jgi:hypothetical protein
MALSNTKMTITERRASTVFNRSNYTIMDIIKISDASPTNYTVNDFFLLYEIIFAFNASKEDASLTTQYLFLEAIVQNLQNGLKANDLTTGARLLQLQAFLAAPLVVFNNIVWGGPTPNMGNSAALAVPSYRVYPVVSDHLQSVDHRPLHTLFVYSRRIYIFGLVHYNSMLCDAGSNSKPVTFSRNRCRVQNRRNELWP